MCAVMGQQAPSSSRTLSHARARAHSHADTHTHTHGYGPARPAGEKMEFPKSPLALQSRACSVTKQRAPLTRVHGQPRYWLKLHRTPLCVAMATPSLRPLKRLRGKATDFIACGRGAQESLPPELLAESDAAKRQVYLVACPHPIQEKAATGETLRAPHTYDHKFLLDALLDSCASPVYDARWAARKLGPRSPVGARARARRAWMSFGVIPRVLHACTSSNSTSEKCLPIAPMA